MTISQLFTGFRTEGKVIATFGQARLVRTIEGQYELRGGSAADRCTAYEWISLFMHHIVVREMPPTTT